MYNPMLGARAICMWIFQTDKGFVAHNLLHSLLSQLIRNAKTADLAGMDYMVAAGYNPYGMIEALQMLERENKSRPIEFLSTHPNPENRIGYLTEKILLHYHQSEKMKLGKDEYQKNVLQRLK
jgi:predicted Zn-dependent protease